MSIGNLKTCSHSDTLPPARTDLLIVPLPMSLWGGHFHSNCHTCPIIFPNSDKKLFLSFLLNLVSNSFINQSKNQKGNPNFPSNTTVPVHAHLGISRSQGPPRKAPLEGLDQEREQRQLGRRGRQEGISEDSALLRKGNRIEPREIFQ